MVDGRDGVERSVIQVKIKECSQEQILSPASDRNTNSHTVEAASKVSILLLFVLEDIKGQLPVSHAISSVTNIPCMWHAAQ